jgi:hypothetical protein
MGKITVTIEKGTDLFGAWAENVPGIYGDGATIKETKKSVLSAIELYKQHNKELPTALQGDIEIDWQIDIQSFLQYYNGIFTKAALERITGINQKQLGHYASGLKHPRKKQLERIECGLHNFITDMGQIHLI